MHVLLTGGLGVNGAWVLRALIGRGDSVTVVENRADYSLVTDLVGKFELVEADVADADAMTDACIGGKIDAVVHMAAIVAADRNPALAVRTNIGGVAAVCQAARDAGVKRVVYTSSRAVYGNITGENAHPTYVPITEDHQRSGVALYDITKVAGEDVGRWFSRNSDLDFVALRFATIFGPGKLIRHGGFSVYSSLIELPARGEPVTLVAGADQQDDLIYVADVAGAILAALDAAEVTSPAYNIGTGGTVSIRDFASAIRVVIPTAEITIGDGLDPMGLGVTYYGALDSSRAQRELGFTPTYSLDAAIRDYVRTLDRVSQPR